MERKRELGTEESGRSRFGKDEEVDLAIGRRIYFSLSLRFRNGKFVETGNQFWFPDDVTLGYIIGKKDH